MKHMIQLSMDGNDHVFIDADMFDRVEFFQETGDPDECGVVVVFFKADQELGQYRRVFETAKSAQRWLTENFSIEFH